MDIQAEGVIIENNRGEDAKIPLTYNRTSVSLPTFNLRHQLPPLVPVPHVFLFQPRPNAYQGASTRIKNLTSAEPTIASAMQPKLTCSKIDACH